MPGLTRTRLTMLGTIALVALLSAELVGLRRQTLRPTNLNFTVHYDGRGAENLDDIWRGELDTPDAGRIAIRIERPAPGPMHAFVFVSHDNVARSFGAEVRGDTTDSGTVHLRGTIDVGTAAGAPIDITMHRPADTSEYRGTIRLSSVQLAKTGPR